MKIEVLESSPYKNSAYNTLADYLHYKNLDTVMEKGCGNLETIHGSIYAEKAYKLGNTLK